MKRSLPIAACLVAPALARAQPAPASDGTPPVYAITPQNRNYHEGITFETNVGVGFMYTTDQATDETDTGLAFAGIDLGIGGWLTEHLALTARGTLVTYAPAKDVRLTGGFLGPSLQYWTSKRLWFGAGVGLGFAAPTGMGESDTKTGFGLDGRAGYTFSQGRTNTFNISIEVTPGFYDGFGVHGAALLVGYQRL
ncbi:MAG TPA: hypothetical protein VFQ53_41635 [Kofleriaceae bacterium]|nr:hypothetical protein [Kofleriaceae bacterium]